jgi:hypothetical protein
VVIFPEYIHPGLLLRVISSHGLGAPRGSLATVQTVGTSESGDWLCTVTYHGKRSPRQGTRLYRSHLWELDLNRFEIVTNEPESRPTRRPRKKQSIAGSRVQLPLPFSDEDTFLFRDGYIDSPD